MSDYLLVGLKEIHEDLFLDKHGRPVIAFSTFKQKMIISNGRRIRMIKDMRRLGILFYLHLGFVKRRTLCGLRSRILRYLEVLHQEEYERENPSENPSENPKD